MIQTSKWLDTWPTTYSTIWFQPIKKPFNSANTFFFHQCNPIKILYSSWIFQWFEKTKFGKSLDLHSKIQNTLTLLTLQVKIQLGSLGMFLLNFHAIPFHVGVLFHFFSHIWISPLIQSDPNLEAFNYFFLLQRTICCPYIQGEN